MFYSSVPPKLPLSTTVWVYRIMGESSADGASSSSSCDPWLSRAAREIVRVHLHRAWRKAAHDDGAPAASADWDVVLGEWNVWELLKETLSAAAAAAAHPHHQLYDSIHNKCPLWPERDVGKVYEENSLETDGNRVGLSRAARRGVIPGSMRRRASEDRHERSRQERNPIFHQCGFCHKNFTSQYYLDRHFLRHHPHNDYGHPRALLLDRKQRQPENTDEYDDDDDDDYYICPARTWCRFLSDTACHDVALEREPYYGPGSAGYASDRHAIYRKLQQQGSRPCTATDLEQAQRACHDVIEQCFFGGGGSGAGGGDENEHVLVNTIGTHLNQTLCARRTCHGRLHHLMLMTTTQAKSSASPSLLLHHHHHPPHAHHHDDAWRDAWSSQEHHRPGAVGILILLLVVGFYGYRCCFLGDNGGGAAARRESSKGSRLLRPSKPSTTTEHKWNLLPQSPPTTHIKQQ